MKIIFLDIDGVLNSETFYVMRNRNMKGLELININPKTEEEISVQYLLYNVDMYNIKLLKKVVEETEAKIVIISSWKTFVYFDKLCEELIKLGLPVIDRTIDNKYNRGEGIISYLNSHDIKDYIIIDNKLYDYNEELIKHLIKTDYKDKRGFDEECEKKAKMMLLNK